MHVNSIDFLRAIGAVAVCIFHLTLGYLHEGNPVYSVFQHGHLGVELFFVITGFLIPSSLLRKNHTIANWGTYMKDRIIRIHPAYIGAVLICVFQEFISTLLPPPMYKPFSVSILDILGHFTYLQPYIGRPWLVILFWTLAVQFQFYMVYGVIHFLFIHEKKWMRFLTLLALITLPFLIGKGEIDYGFGLVNLNNFLPHYMHIFLVGVLLFMFTQGFLSKIEFWIFMAINCYALFYYRGGMYVWYDGDFLRPFAVICASICILFINIQHKIFEFLGKISYSLYLIHLPIGWSFMGFLKNFLNLNSEFGLTIALFTATALSIFCAYLFNKYFEEPAVQKVKEYFK